MTLNDPLANVLSHVLNADREGKRELTTKNNSKVIRRVLELMNEAGYIGSYEVIKDKKGNSLKINLLGRLNKTGVIKPQHQIGKDEYERWEKRYLPAKDFGIILISTNQGIITHIAAKELGIGGKLISYCY
ncbi:30S ribosomal protein S8 [Candidatus Woesearchaeota archaeon]|nr:30S ribosomal protein S8 [Candidatus Woesearchaeota archaeon]